MVASIVADFFSNTAVGVGTLIASAVSVIISIVALTKTLQDARTNRINANSWQTYTMYNSDEIKRARQVTRRVGRDEAWKAVHDLASYNAYFQLDAPTAVGSASEHGTLRDDEQHIHYLLAFYHQVGMLLHRQLLDRDFTMLLLGEGLDNRWNVLGIIPGFYPNSPYSGMFEFYLDYKDWEKARFPKLMRHAKRSQELVGKAAANR